MSAAVRDLGNRTAPHGDPFRRTLAAKVAACDVTVWLDGIYPTRCGHVLVDGECVVHGNVPSPPPGEAFRVAL